MCKIAVFATRFELKEVPKVNDLQLEFANIMSGEMPYTIDAKGRMSFPQRFREILGERFMLTRGSGHNIVCYNEAQWQDTVRRIAAMPMGKNKDNLTHLVVKGATPVEADKLGRILIPQTLREFANLTHDVYVVGAIDVAEIWDKAAYESHNIADEDIYDAYSALE